ncbi:hypothetical protein JCM10449v2_001034 [Rhodotorula kratochvilovae]
MAPTRATYESNTDTCSYSIDFAPPADDQAALASLAAQILAFAQEHTHDYIWHKQGLTLQVSPLSFAAPAAARQHLFLQGKSEVTDAVDDEWLLVWLLRQVSTHWDDAVIAVDDDDGEFLLIEAADHLPSWLTPQNAANRVWIHRGRLHLVPLEHKSALPFEDKTLSPSFDADEDGFLDRAAAIELVRDDRVATFAPKEVEDAVWARIDGYPAKMAEHHHRTLAYLPTDIALALADSPSLIAEAVGAFYEREPATLRAVNTMSRFPPSPPLASASSTSSDMTDSSPSLPGTVLVPTRLTRPLYSQLVLQRFYAPKAFEKAGWADGARGKEDERRRSVGMKIACGFEMLYKSTSALPRSSTSSSDEVDTSTPAYQAYLSSLRTRGFFGDEAEGSAAWQAKERSAREGWIKAQTGRPTLPFAQRVDAAVARARALPSPLLARIADPGALTAEEAAALEDSEEWMALDEQGLEEILASKSSGGGALGDSDLEESDDEEDEDGDEGAGMEGVEGGKEPTAAEDRKARKVARRLEEMAGKVEDFVQGRGAASGALFDDERDDDDSDDDDEDEDAQMPPLSADERAARMEKLVAALPAEQWGQKDEHAPPPLEADEAGASSAPVAREPREAKLTKEVYEGASDLEDDSSEDEAMPEGEEGLGGEDVEGEDGPSVVNEEDVLDLGEEMDEFLKFATETLGLTEAQYEKILSDRRGRGAFVPGPPKEKKTNVLPSAKKTSSSRTAAPPKPSPAAATAAGNPPPPRERLRNPNLTDFDTLMEQMESELARAKGGRAPAAAAAAEEEEDDGPAPTGKYPSRQTRDPHRVVVDSLSDSDDDGDGEGDDLAAMDAELAGLLQGVTGGAGDGPMDLNLVKNFLESFQSQGGFAGPAGNLAGRLGFPLPRDAADGEGEGR